MIYFISRLKRFLEFGTDTKGDEFGSGTDTKEDDTVEEWETAVTTAREAEVNIVELIHDYHSGMTAYKGEEIEAKLKTAHSNWETVHIISERLFHESQNGTDREFFEEEMVAAYQHVNRTKSSLEYLREHGIERFVATRYLDPDQEPDYDDMLDLMNNTDKSLLELEDELFGDVPNMTVEQARDIFLQDGE